MKLNEAVTRNADEEYYDLLVRLFENKKAYGLSCIDIAHIMNSSFGLNYGECKYRKEWKVFNRGRKYERKRLYTGVYRKILSISDLHVPFQLPIESFSKYSKKIHILVLNGDLIDQQSISKFPKSYRISPIEEIIQCRKYLIELIQYLKPKQVIVNYGNHELRFGAYLNKHIDNEIKELMPETVLDLIFVDGFYHYDKQTRIKSWYEPMCELFEDTEIIYTQDWKCKIGKTWFAHPIAYSTATLKTCENAMRYFHQIDKEPFDCVVLGHTHRTGDTRKGMVTLYEQGACCETERMNYTDGKLSDTQQKGFVFICQDKDGNLLYDKSKRIILD